MKRPTIMRLKREYIYLILICLIYLLFISANLSRDFDATEASDLSTSARELNISFIRTGEPHPPLHYLILRFWTEAFGTGHVISRIPSILLGLGAIIFLWAKAGKIPALLLAISPPFIEFSGVIDKYTLFIFMTITCMYFYYKRNNPGLLVSSILLIQSHFYGAFILLGIWIDSLIKKRALITLLLVIVAITLIPQALLTLQEGLYDFPYDEPFHDMIKPEKRSFTYNLYDYLYEDGFKWYGFALLGIAYALYIKNFKRSSFMTHYIFTIVPISFIILSFKINIQHYQLLFLLPYIIVQTTEHIRTIKGKHFIIGAIILISILGVADQLKQTSDESIRILQEQYDNETIITDGFYAFLLDYYTELPYKSYHMKELKNLEKLINDNTWVIYDISGTDRTFFNRTMEKYLERCEKKTNRLYYCRTNTTNLINT